MSILLRQLVRTGFRRGLTHGSRTWLITGIVAFTVNYLVRAARTDADYFEIRQLRPGDTFEVSVARRQK